MANKNFNIFWHELKSHRQSAIVWSVSISVVSVFFILLYPAYTKDVDAIKQVFANYPPALLKAFSLNLDIFFSFLGFYSYILTYIIMAGAVQSLNLGVNTLAKEATDKTADFLLAKPTSRQNIVNQKLIANVCILLITNVVFICSTLIAASFVTEQLNITTYFLLTATLFITQLVFLSIGLTVSAYVNKVKNVVAISLPIVFGLYIMGTFYTIFEIPALRYISPLSYFDSNYIIMNTGYQASFLLMAIIVTFVCTIISYNHYTNKDINVG